MRLSDCIIVPLRLDFPCLRNSKRLIDHLVDLGIARERLRLVVNRQGVSGEIPVNKVEQALGMTIFQQLPDEPRDLLKAANNGEPVVVTTPNNRFARGLGVLARQLMSTLKV